MKDDYPPISDYGYISDCHSAALISKAGSIDWCCMPRIDSRSCFGRLLDWQQGGYCRITPAKKCEASRRYLEDSLILETAFENSEGQVKLLDCLAMKKGGQQMPYRQILRIIEGISGKMQITVDIVPRFDYGDIRPWIRKINDKFHILIGGSDGLVISGDIPLVIKELHNLRGNLTVEKGQQYYLSIMWRRPEELDEINVKIPATSELDERFRETRKLWRNWAGRCKYAGPYQDYVLRSALVLKGLVNAPTGAIAAAATTSLPEAAGSSRNWDYRLSWIRDSCFTVRSLGELGYEREAEGFRRFIERCTAGSAEQLQVLYGVGGERRLTEMEITGMEGYRQAKPVRIGNGAEKQIQLDVFGEVLDLLWQWHLRGHSPDDTYWEFLVDTVNRASRQWKQPDRGIWELRGQPRHYVESKAMCWAALDKGIKLAEELKRNAPLENWKRVREEIKHEIESKGYDTGRGVFIQAFDHPVMDASLLLIPSVGFIAYDDERMIRTTDAINEELCESGFLRRYPKGDDGLEGREGAFLACSFWLAECYAKQGRRNQAQDIFKRALSACNDLMLFSEEFDTRTGQMAGNIPQGLTHLSLIAAAVALAKSE